jgi:hypothetical protein
MPRIKRRQSFLWHPNPASCVEKKSPDAIAGVRAFHFNQLVAQSGRIATACALAMTEGLRRVVSHNHPIADQVAHYQQEMAL